MSRFEDALIFHPYACQIVDVKKTAVIDIVGSDPPIRQAKSLRLDKFVQLLEARRHNRVAVHLFDGTLDCRSDLGDASA